MKTLKFIGLLLICFAMSAPVMAQTGNGQLTVPLSSPGKPYTLNVNFLTGSIEVIGYDGNEIVIEFAAEGTKPKPAASVGGMRVIGGGSSSVTAREKNNVVSVNG